MKTQRFEPSLFEKHIQELWEKENVYQTTPKVDQNSKAYVLVMFPYPSGYGLHTGHARIYTGTDVLARFYRMQGKAVLHPMGWDAFGLPAENAAIKAHKNPQDIVPGNITNFKNQFRLLGMSYDWSKEINTTDPKYYAVTQYLFLQFYKHGLLYKKDTPVFYCPFCKTGLAQEEVMEDGTHERCGNVVEKRNLPQWIFRITEYADSLLEGLKGLDWPTGILEMQKNWIGRKEGIDITYNIEGMSETVTCFTTRPDTNFGATFVVIAPEHPLVSTLDKPDVKEYVGTVLAKTERERLSDGKKKTGVFTGLYAINKLNGRRMPIWISDFVLMNVGTGAVVGVPGHDKRDFEFAQAMGMPVVRVVVGSNGDTSDITRLQQVQEETGTMINSEFLDGKDIHEATNVMMDHLEAKGWGKRTVSYHVRDWIFSRQRYWGEPIPMVYCKACAGQKISYWDCDIAKDDDLRLDKGLKNKTFNAMVKEIKDTMYGWFPVLAAELPLELPYLESYEPTETGESPLVQANEWVDTTCPVCKGPARRETDTMPNWAGSCWYFLAFPMAEELGKQAPEELLAKACQQSWMPVDWYIGGAEHAVLHLLYARFWMHILNDLGSVTFREPFTRLRNVGMVLAADGRKMSKSWGNVINPDDIIHEYGTDALRVYEMFMAPFSQEIAWSTQTLQGAYRFIRRIWHIYHDSAKITKDPSQEAKKLISELQRTIKKISTDTPDVKFNTSIASAMEFLNLWEEPGAALSQAHAKDFLKLLAPYAPFITDYLWREVLGEGNSIHLASWPNVDQSALIKTDSELPVQVNGRVRDRIMIFPEALQEEALAKALDSAKIQAWIAGKNYTTVYVKGKILNFVIEEVK